MTELQKAIAIAQFFQTPPPQVPPPPQVGPNSDLRLGQVYQQPERFPSKVFPQLDSLKRAIQRNQRKIAREKFIRESPKMEHLHWASGTRADRPFENMFRPEAAQEVRKLRRPQLQGKVIPTEYYLEQLELARPSTVPMPDAEPIQIDRSGIQEFIVFFTTEYIKPALDLIGSILSPILNALSIIILRISTLLKAIVGFIVAVEWEMLLAFALATQVARWLPQMGGNLSAMEGSGGMGDVMDHGDKPLYIIRIPANAAMRTGIRGARSAL